MKWRAWKPYGDDGSWAVSEVIEGAPVISMGNRIADEIDVGSDAALIAAAPDLLAALETIVSTFAGSAYLSRVDDAALSAGAAAIAKARGGK